MDAESIKDLFRQFGPVAVRRMFGGAGVFVDGMMIALVSRGVIYLKADAETIPGFEREGQGPFTYGTKNGERRITSYWRMPDRLYDDTDELARWARASAAVAQRASARRPKAASPRGSGRTRRKAKP